MKIQPISTMKQKAVSIKTRLADGLQEYAEYLSNKSENGEVFQASDIVAALLSDKKKCGDVPMKVNHVTKQLTLKLPTSCWNTLENITKDTDQKAGDILEHLASGLMNDKQFLSYRNNKGRAGAETEKAPKKEESKRKVAAPDKDKPVEA